MRLSRKFCALVATGLTLVGLTTGCGKSEEANNTAKDKQSISLQETQKQFENTASTASSLIGYAMKSVDPDLMKSYLNLGIAPNGQDEKKRTPLFFIAFSVKTDDNSRENDLSNAQSLLAAGANPDIADENGITPLMMASYHHKAKLVSLLLKNGADPSLQSDKGVTAARFADGKLLLLSETARKEMLKNNDYRETLIMLRDAGNTWKEKHTPATPPLNP